MATRFVVNRFSQPQKSSLGGGKRGGAVKAGAVESGVANSDAVAADVDVKKLGKKQSGAPAAAGRKKKLGRPGILG
jgi:hypothetical protein